MTIEQILAHPGLSWLALAACLAIIELLIPGIFFVFVAAGAAVTGIVALILPGTPLVVEIGLFAVASVISVTLGRRWYLSNPVPSSDPLLNDRVARMIGQVVTVADPIIAGKGRVRVGDGEWPAHGVDAPAGAQVRVTGADNGTLTVEPLA